MSASAPRWSARRSLAAELLLALALLAVAEVGVRLWVAQPTSTLFPALFSTPLTTGKYLAYYRRAQLAAPLDVLLVGMSQMMRVSAEQMMAELSPPLGRPISVFNGAAPLHTIELDRRLLQDIFLQLKRPQVVVYSITPVNLLLERSPAAIDNEVRAFPGFRLYEPGPVGWLRRTLVHHSDLLLYREGLYAALTGVDLAAPGDWIPQARAFTVNGDAAFRPRARIARLTVFDLQRQKEFRSFRSRLRSTPLFDNIARLAQLTRAHGMQLVVLNHPVDAMFFQLLPEGVSDYDLYCDRLRAAVAAVGAVYYEAQGNGLDRPELFVDTMHYNDSGMRALSTALSEFLLHNGVLGPSVAAAR